jgi:hypothetical protein
VLQKHRLCLATVANGNITLLSFMGTYECLITQPTVEAAIGSIELTRVQEVADW